MNRWTIFPVPRRVVYRLEERYFMRRTLCSDQTCCRKSSLNATNSQSITEHVCSNSLHSSKCLSIEPLSTRTAQCSHLIGRLGMIFLPTLEGSVLNSSILQQGHFFTWLQLARRTFNCANQKEGFVKCVRMFCSNRMLMDISPVVLDFISYLNGGNDLVLGKRPF